jgi:hypothetical protein
MVLWFAGFSWLIIWLVFRDPAFDYRFVLVGALLPDLLDAPFGGARVAHTLLASAIALVVVMLATQRRRRVRRSLLAVPIGTMLHLVLDGMWTVTELFWWPLFGGELGDRPLPSLDRGWLLVAMEVAGGVALVWCWRRFGLTDPDRRRLLLTTGRLDRAVLG